MLQFVLNGCKESTYCTILAEKSVRTATQNILICHTLFRKSFFRGAIFYASRCQYRTGEGFLPPPSSSLFDYTAVEGKEGDRKGGTTHVPAAQEEGEEEERAALHLYMARWGEGGERSTAGSSSRDSTMSQEFEGRRALSTLQF